MDREIENGIREANEVRDLLRPYSIMHEELGLTRSIMADDVNYMAFHKALDLLCLRHTNSVSVCEVRRMERNYSVSGDEEYIWTWESMEKYPKYLSIDSRGVNTENHWLISVLCRACPEDWSHVHTPKGFDLIHPMKKEKADD